MTDESEKRFHSIMDKLFHAPPRSPSSSSSVQSLRGKKRPSSSLALVEPKLCGNVAAEARPALSEAPLCRPWDRGDLMRRLATFKSMTWFAKPEAVSALNCARRGWINVDIDMISCEACGARFLFSTPSAWNQQQVEKAAAVFSLKLDKGHKLLCPWIDNVCSDTLSQFPPTSPPVLVEKFKERCTALLQLSALPVISSSAIKYMQSPEFEQIIEPLLLEYERGSIDVLRTECRGQEHNVDSAKKYYQAQKLIALCGWEPRTLPYVVDSRFKSSSSLEMENIPNSFNLVSSQKDTGMDMQSARINERTEENGNNPNRVQCDPNSVVLDCRLCGASVGLWAFITVPQPLELVRFVGYAEIDGKNHLGTYYCSTDTQGGSEIMSACSDSATASKDRPQSLRLTIAGGPPPAKQNFKATISFPVIGRNLRARFCDDSEFSDHVDSDKERVQLGTRCDSTDKENENHASLEKLDAIMTGSIFEDGVSNDQTENRVATQQDNCRVNMLLENEVNGELDNLTAEDPGGYRVIDPSISATDDITNKIGKDAEPESSLIVSPTSGESLQISGSNVVDSEDPILVGHEESPCLPFCLEGDMNIDISDLFGQTTSVVRLNNQNDGKGNLQSSLNNEVTSFSTGKDVKQESVDQAMEFDPIRQHRHFCPWIASVCRATPGWKQTLSALQRQKGFLPSFEKSSSTSIIKVDDPITSVRNLFTSPRK